MLNLMNELVQKSRITEELYALVKKTGNVNSLDPADQFTALQSTLSIGTWDEAKALLDYGADAAFRTSKNENLALLCAALSKDRNTIEKLLEYFKVNNIPISKSDFIEAIKTASIFNNDGTFIDLLDKANEAFSLTNEDIVKILVDVIETNKTNSINNVLSFVDNEKIIISDQEVIFLLNKAVEQDNIDVLKQLLQEAYFSSILSKRPNLDNLIEYAKKSNSKNALVRLKKISSSKNKTTCKNIVFITHAPNGTLGDPSSALKLMTDMKEKYGSNLELTLVVNVGDKDKKRVMTLVGDKIKIKTMQGNYREFDIARTLENADAVVLYPTPHFFTKEQKGILFEYNKPIIAATEYDIDEDYQLATKRDIRVGRFTSYFGTGLGKDYLGRDNLGIYLTQENVDVNINYLEKIDSTTDLELKNLLLRDRNSNELNKSPTHALYYAYYNNMKGEHPLSTIDLNLFLKLAISESIKKTHDITTVDIVLPLKELEDKDVLVSAQTIIPSLKETFKESLCINYYKKNDKGELELIRSEGDGKIIVNLINAFPISPQTVDILMKASNPLTLLTGDQSVSEGISNNKLVLYQTMFWKLGFLIALTEKTEMYLGYESFLTQFFSLQVTLGSQQDSNTKRSAQDQIVDLVENHAEELLAEMKGFCEYLKTNHNLYNNFGPRLMETINLRIAIEQGSKVSVASAKNDSRSKPLLHQHSFAKDSEIETNKDPSVVAGRLKKPIG